MQAQRWSSARPSGAARTQIPRLHDPQQIELRQKRLRVHALHRLEEAPQLLQLLLVHTSPHLPTEKSTRTQPA